MHVHAFKGGELMAFMNQWLADIRRVKDITDALSKELEARTSLTLNGYYVLYFLAHSEEKKMRLNILQSSNNYRNCFDE